MFNKSLFASLITAFNLTFGFYLMGASLMGQNSTTQRSSSIAEEPPDQIRSNLITDNPFVPKNNLSLNKSKEPTGPQSLANQLKVLNKYLQFRVLLL